MGSETLDAGAVEAVADLTRRSINSAGSVHYGDGRTGLILVDSQGGHFVADTTPKNWRAPLPSDIEQHITFNSQQSFIDYVRPYVTPNTRLFALLAASGPSSVMAVIDWHGSDGVPGRKAHVATYQLRDSEEWTRWASISADEPRMNQLKFVQFLEENCGDIADPPGADILELARDFSATRNVKFDSAIRLQNGDMSFDYVSEATAKSKNGSVAVPNKFRLEIPVFYGEPVAEVFAFLRWNVDDGLKLGIKIHRPVFVRQSLFEAIARNVSEAVGAPVYSVEKSPV